MSSRKFREVCVKFAHSIFVSTSFSVEFKKSIARSLREVHVNFERTLRELSQPMEFVLNSNISIHLLSPDSSFLININDLLLSKLPNALTEEQKL